MRSCMRLFPMAIPARQGLADVGGRDRSRGGGSRIWNGLPPRRLWVRLEARMADFAAEREKMVRQQIAGRGIKGPRLLDAFRAVPREAFVPEGVREFAYEDGPLPIEAEQTISQPYIVALMIEAAEVAPGDKVLEIGAGSGYAAAVMSRIAAEVIAVERHSELAALARQRMAGLGYYNVRIVEEDGTGGLPDEAPFEAILCAASGSHVTETLRLQLSVGGILVMPVREPDNVQKLVKVTRRGEREFEEEDLGAVRFVPLIGAHGWTEPGGERAMTVTELIAAAAEPLPELEDPAFAGAYDRFGDARVVLLGEASHGTSEFYRARASITRRLIEERGFTIVAVEADWPDAAAVDRHVRHRPARERAEPPFRRFPTWMWRNTDVAALVEWLREHNGNVPELDRRAGFYGLDLYNMSGSITAVLEYLDEVDPEAAAAARERYGCLTPWQKEPSTYGRAVLT